MMVELIVQSYICRSDKNIAVVSFNSVAGRINGYFPEGISRGKSIVYFDKRFHST